MIIYICDMSSGDNGCLRPWPKRTGRSTFRISISSSSSWLHTRHPRCHGFYHQISAGWWLGHPSEKYSSIGMISNPTEWENNQNGNQTTNQIRLSRIFFPSSIFCELAIDKTNYGGAFQILNNTNPRTAQLKSLGIC